MNIYYIYAVVLVFISCLSQILLKKSANSDTKVIKKIFNIKVILAYAILFLVMFMNSKFVYSHIELGKISMIEALGYVFIPLLSITILKEKISKKQILGISIILLGIVIFQI